MTLFLGKAVKIGLGCARGEGSCTIIRQVEVCLEDMDFTDGRTVALFFRD